MAKVKKEISAPEEDIEKIEDKIRDLINWVKVKNNEELEEGEGKKIEDDTADELIEQLKKISSELGMAFD